MALDPKQIEGLNAASTRIANGTANDADRRNVAYAKKTFGYTSPTTSSSSTPTPPTTPTTNQPAQGTSIPKDLADKYFEAFGRTINDKQDLANYKYNPTVFTKQVEDKLKQTRAANEAKNAKANETLNNNNATSTADDAYEKKRQEQIAWLESQGFSAGEKAILRQVINDDSYKSSGNIPSTTELSKIISDAATNAATDTNPYFETLTAREIEDTKNQLSDIRGGFERYQKQEAVDYKTKLATTKQTLRAKGLTFSGSSRSVLGSEGALDSAGVEGGVPEQRRLDYEKTLAGVTSKTRDLGVAAERQLGSNKLNDLNFGTYTTPYGDGSFYNPSGNVATGDLELQRLKAIEQSKWDRVRQQSPFYYN